MHRTITASCIALCCATLASAQSVHDSKNDAIDPQPADTGRFAPPAHPMITDQSADDTAQGCEPAATPVQEHIIVDGVNYPMTTVRYLPIRANGADAGHRTALRVRVLDLPPGHEGNEGVEFYVGAPRRVCEKAGLLNPPQPENPPSYGCYQGANPDPHTMHLATVQNEPYYMDWHGTCVNQVCVDGLKPGVFCTTTADCAGTVNVYSSVFAPTMNSTAPATFEVAAIREACAPPDESDFSDPLLVTLARWGDVLADNTTRPARPPNGNVDISDIIGILNKWKNIPGAPFKARADVEPACPDHLIQISDCVYALDAFAGRPYPFPPADPNEPCP